MSDEYLSREEDNAIEMALDGDATKAIEIITQLKCSLKWTEGLLQEAWEILESLSTPGEDDMNINRVAQEIANYLNSGENQDDKRS